VVVEKFAEERSSDLEVAREIEIHDGSKEGTTQEETTISWRSSNPWIWFNKS
jgi:hypothetical protein